MPRDSEKEIHEKGFQANESSDAVRKRSYRLAEEPLINNYTPTQDISMTTSGESNIFLIHEPISESPKFSEALEEELRARLNFVKAALQKSQPDYEHQHIQQAFSNKSLKAFISLVKISQSLEQDQIKKILIDRLQEGKEEVICAVIVKYIGYFIVEFMHFLRLHGFLKKSRPPVAGNHSEQRYL